MKPVDDDHVADRLFDGLRPPQPPPELRERVLLEAQAVPATEPLLDVWTRIWENRWLRMAWAASVLVLLTGNLILIPGQPEPAIVIAEASVDEEVAEFLRPIRIAEKASPNLGRSGGGRRELVGIDEGGNTS